MGIDAGFDMVPTLSTDLVDTGKWSEFISAIEKRYEDDDLVAARSGFIEFMVGDQPRLPLDGQKFLRFSSRISGDCSTAAKYIDEVTELARGHFGGQALGWSEASDQRGHYGWELVKASWGIYGQVCDAEHPNTTSVLHEADYYGW